MRKVPTLFLRNDPGDPHHVTPSINPTAEWVLTSHMNDVVATRKYDGTCVMPDDNGHWWARREVKPGKPTPADFVLADHDEVTGKRMGWLPIEPGWQFYAMFAEAREFGHGLVLPGTWELYGPKINGNPEQAQHHTLIRHNAAQWLEFDGHRLVVDPVSPYRQLSDILTRPEFTYEGVVWHHRDGRMAKIKVRDFRR